MLYVAVDMVGIGRTEALDLIVRPRVGELLAAAPYAALMVCVSAPATFLLTRDARRASVR